MLELAASMLSETWKPKIYLFNAMSQWHEKSRAKRHQGDCQVKLLKYQIRIYQNWIINNSCSSSKPWTVSYIDTMNKFWFFKKKSWARTANALCFIGQRLSIVSLTKLTCLTTSHSLKVYTCPKSGTCN